MLYVMDGINKGAGSHLHLKAEERVILPLFIITAEHQHLTVDSLPHGPD